MAHFLKMTDDDGAVSYMNLDMIAEVDEEERTVTLVNEAEYEFDDDLNDVEWRAIMNFVNTHKVL
jgi:hypothetical protein